MSYRKRMLPKSPSTYDDATFTLRYVERLNVAKLREYRVSIKAELDEARRAKTKAVVALKRRQIEWIDLRIERLDTEQALREERSRSGPDPVKEARRKDFYLHFFKVVHRALPEVQFKSFVAEANRRASRMKGTLTMLRVILFQDSGVWIAQGIDLDIVAQGRTEQKAIDNLRATIVLHGADLDDVKPADAASVLAFESGFDWPAEGSDFHVRKTA